ncbi:SGNH/GDSL hydrolase family protein [Aliiruegeria lutimaris]|uniref:Lysophospholipase L1 n=1 Tax=Aliiruegeria lutimaris TaxID=571298 RepID=A0A1G9HN94_9RHOB|nr:SGNH/GDSL hydrolase family protein [Aliiruegeria lutimaris]SDL14451.1 Lysophospholipase L1 [Aliiruegeria lutimaris]
MRPSLDRTVLCFGDSNTHGTVPMSGPDDLARYARDIRWPGVMAGVLGHEWHVIEEGHPGRTTVHDDPVDGAHKNGIAMLPALLESHRPIDLVLIMLGTNDLKARFSVPPSDIGISLERLARVVQASNAGPSGAPPDLILVAPTPIEETGWLAGMFAGGAAKSRSLDTAIANSAARVGAKYVNAGAYASVDPLDGIHLTSDGHRALGIALAATVTEWSAAQENGRETC